MQPAIANRFTIACSKNKLYKYNKKTKQTKKQEMTKANAQTNINKCKHNKKYRKVKSKIIDKQIKVRSPILSELCYKSTLILSSS